MDILQKTITCEEYDVFESSIDTGYFGVLSAKAVLKQPCASTQKQDALLHSLRDFKFVMLTNKASNPVNNRWLGERTTAFLVDINIQLRKDISPLYPPEPCPPNGLETTICDGLEEDRQVLHIAETYFQHSQFLNDPYLPAEKARCIYGDIVKNAFEKPGRFFVLTRRAGVVAGFLLFGINAAQSTATVQLIAVNQDFKRQGIGHMLIRSMEEYVIPQGISTVYVGTQFTNFGALKFYNVNGYTQYECNSIYHYWPQRTAQGLGPV